MELTEQIRSIIDSLKSNYIYSVHIVTEYEVNRPDKIMNKYYGSDYKKYQYIFFYLNDFIFPLDQTTLGTYIKIYDIKTMYNSIQNTLIMETSYRK